MTETGFYILFVFRKKGMLLILSQKSRDLTEGQLSISPGICMEPGKDGKWSDCVREEKKALFYHKLGNEFLG